MLRDKAERILELCSNRGSLIQDLQILDNCGEGFAKSARFALLLPCSDSAEHNRTEEHSIFRFLCHGIDVHEYWIQMLPVAQQKRSFIKSILLPWSRMEEQSGLDTNVACRTAEEIFHQINLIAME
ncbi:hypothetical protein SUGI_0507220 [Cryptomeria japonica]|nr:hypothetical protein SUGI_0507220 [Cryptomeria japonica]